MFFNIFLKNSSIELIILMLGMRNCYIYDFFLARKRKTWYYINALREDIYLIIYRLSPKTTHSVDWLFKSNGQKVADVRNNFGNGGGKNKKGGFTRWVNKKT